MPYTITQEASNLWAVSFRGKMDNIMLFLPFTTMFWNLNPVFVKDSNFVVR